MSRPVYQVDILNVMVEKGYLDRERVVGVSEIGYNLINDLEEEIFVRQMDIATEKDMLMTIQVSYSYGKTRDGRCSRSHLR